MNQAFIEGVEKAENPEENKQNNDKPSSGGTGSEEKNQGALIIDASVVPHDIKFPTDLDLLNEVREQTERIIDKLWDPGEGKRNPRTREEHSKGSV